MDSRLWHCPSCDETRAFVQPPCVDGHTDDGGDCPEWACADCGTAFVTGSVTGSGAAATERARVGVAA